ncbi:hypothetical protein SAMN04488128_1011808 [Chitinophaga eiseniae]|uniref:Uncharacterized protein n=1 Tax=Chitinophaga eiseniae TaxID=634771 RepID=A0A1T4NYL6_9BACT|nr:hypothetical protein [Chitinophaga eiseniae]SJZ84192.1 hypothetical protein SAMN04488128_1011808 [Chitinophaga eiseniae]
MATSVIKNLFYASPYSPLPPGVGTAGITLQTDPGQSPTPANVKDPVLVIRLRMAANPQIVIAVSPTSGPTTSVTTAFIQPQFPLSATDSYMLDVIWVRNGASLPSINWNAAITSAPVIAAEVSILSASFDGSNVTAILDYGPSGMSVGAQVNVYSLSGGVYVNVGSNQAQGNTVTVPVDSTGFPSVFFLSAQAVMPTTNAGGAGAFSGPFSLGPATPITAACGIPQAAKTISAAAYNGKTLTLSWALDTVQGCVAPDSSRIQVLSNGKVIGTYHGGPLSAIIPLDVYNQSGITIAVSTVSNNIGSKPLPFPLITTAPVITNVVANKSAGKVTASVTIPTGQAVQGYLMDGDNILAGPVTAAGNVLSFDYATSTYNVEGMVGLRVAGNITSADGIVTGPRSAGAILLATTPLLTSATIYTDPAGPTKWRIDLGWERLPDAASAITSYTVSLLQDNVSVATQTLNATFATLSIDKTAIDATKTQTIQVSATGATGGASPVQTLYALFAAPTLTALLTTQSQVAVNWTAPQIPSGNIMPALYQPVVIAGGSIIARGSTTTANSGAIALSDIAVPDTGNIAVMVSVALGPVVLQPDTGMAGGTSATPILKAPMIQPVSADPLTNIATLHWAAVDSAATYTVLFTDGTSHKDISTTSYPLQQALTTGAQVSYTVQANNTSNGVALAGPPSIPATIPTSVANISRVRFDGSNVGMEWAAVADALSYAIFVYDDLQQNTYTAITSQTSATFIITPAAGRTYTAYVQPVTIHGTALRGISGTLFSTGIYVSQQPAATAYPYVYLAQAMSAMGTAAANPPAQAITMYLPELGATAGALGATPITAGPFSITPSGVAALPYKLTISASEEAWSFNTVAIRPLLQQDYITFLKAVEKPPAGNVPGATAYGIALVQSAIAAALPQTFAELLYYNFGFSTATTAGAGYIDLRPGMVLRVTASDYINIPGSVPSWINGYGPGAPLDFEIGSYLAGANWRTGFDAFLSTLSSLGALGVTTPALSSGYTQAGLAGAVDLYYPQFIQPFYRLYIPSAINAAWGQGSNSTQSNFTLVAAASYTALQNTTVIPSTTPTAYFRGRTTVQVLIKVMVNGVERLTPVGTSAGNLLEQLNMRPAATSGALSHLRIYRSVTPAMTGPNPSDSLGPLLELRVDWNGLSTYAMGNGLTALSIPLLPGDQIFTDKTGS